MLNKSQEAELRLWKEEKKSWQGLRELGHSLRSHFAVIHTYIEMKNIDGLQQYLKSVFDDLDSLEDYVGGLPPALSVALGDKTKRARSCCVSLLNILFAEMLDNAIDAARKAKKEKPGVSLTISPSRFDMVDIECSNDSTHFYLKQLNGTLETTKRIRRTTVLVPGL